MKKIKFLTLVIALGLLVFTFSNNPGGAYSQDKYEAELGKKQKELSARQEELARQKEEKLRKLAQEKAKREQELSTRQEELTRQVEEQRRAIALEAAKRQRELKARQEELIKQKAERLKNLAERKQKEQEDALKKLQETKARQEELARQKAEKERQLAKQKAQREKELKVKQAELARQKEERIKQETQLKAKREQELKAKQEELARQKEEHLKKLAEQRQKRQEELLERLQETKARQEELARQKEEKEKQLAAEKAKREQELKAKQEELARQKEEREKQLVEQRIQREKELKAKQEELARQKAERERQLAAEKAKREEERQAKIKAKEEADRQLLAKKQELEIQRLEAKNKREQELKARQEELARQKEGRIKQEAELKAKKEQELKAKQEEERKVREEELARQKEEKEKQLAAEKTKREEELKSKQEALAKQKEEKEIQLKQPQAERIEEKQKQIAAQEAKRQEELKAKQEELAQRREELAAKINEMKKSTAQEKAFTEAMLSKQRKDQAKIKKIEELWRQARKLYERGMFEESIKYFEEVVRLEGNPRIKYTPNALEYIEKAKNKSVAKGKVTLTKEIQYIEGEMINEVLKKQVPPYVEPPKSIEKLETAPLIEPPPIRKKLKEKKVTMDFDKVDLKSVISFLSQESGINLIASKKVLELETQVTARFDDTPINEVIKYITKSQGLVYRIDKEVVWIAEPEEIAQEPLETRVYYLTKGGGIFTEFSPISGASTETGLGGSSASITKILTIEDTLKEIVPWPADAKLTYDKRINALLVRNSPQNLQTLEDLLYNLDITPCQVLIEARFLEVNVTDTEELGLEWKFANENFPIEKKQGSFKHGFAKDSGLDFSAFSRVAEGFNLTYKGLLTTPQFETVLHALEESKKTKTLSSPRITTLNNQLATIKVVDEWIYPTRYEYEIVQFDLNGDGDFSDANETTYKNVPKDFLRRDVGILLKVIPSVGADRKTISLALIPEVSEATADGFSYTGDVKLPKFTSRNLSTTVVVNSSDTVVLGGLIKESRTKTLTKVPILGDIPLLGAFFKKHADSIERKNLLIFVTAKVLSASGEEVVVAKK